MLARAAAAVARKLPPGKGDELIRQTAKSILAQAALAPDLNELGWLAWTRVPITEQLRAVDRETDQELLGALRSRLRSLLKGKTWLDRRSNIAETMKLLCQSHDEVTDACWVELRTRTHSASADDAALLSHIYLDLETTSPGYLDPDRSLADSLACKIEKRLALETDENNLAQLREVAVQLFPLVDLTTARTHARALIDLALKDRMGRAEIDCNIIAALAPNLKRKEGAASDGLQLISSGLSPELPPVNLAALAFAVDSVIDIEPEAARTCLGKIEKLARRWLDNPDSNKVATALLAIATATKRVAGSREVGTLGDALTRCAAGMRKADPESAERLANAAAACNASPGLDRSRIRRVARSVASALERLAVPEASVPDLTHLARAAVHLREVDHSIAIPAARQIAQAVATKLKSKDHLSAQIDLDVLANLLPSLIKQMEPHDKSETAAQLALLAFDRPQTSTRPKDLVAWRAYYSKLLPALDDRTLVRSFSNPLCVGGFEEDTLRALAARASRTDKASYRTIWEWLKVR